MYTGDYEVDLDEVLEEVDIEYLATYILGRNETPGIDQSKIRKLIVKLMGLPEWYHSDKEGLCREILKLF
jgi:hypothetical protein